MTTNGSSGPDGVGSTALLEARGIVKRFGHVTALDGADFSVGRGEVVALIGDNGAGKSTLSKIVSGVQRADEGELGSALHLQILLITACAGRVIAARPARG